MRIFAAESVATSDVSIKLYVADAAMMGARCIDRAHAFEKEFPPAVKSLELRHLPLLLHTAKSLSSQNNVMSLPVTLPADPMLRSATVISLMPHLSICFTIVTVREMPAKRNIPWQHLVLEQTASPPLPSRNAHLRNILLRDSRLAGWHGLLDSEYSSGSVCLNTREAPLRNLHLL